jgi:dienelactone hydrolase
MFSLAGRPLPYLPYGLSGGSGVYNLFDDGLNALPQHPDAVIPVEKINGPVMVICGKRDGLWPSCRMSAQVVARLAANNFKHAVRILKYAEAGHAVFGPTVFPETPTFTALGGAAGNAARLDSWPKAVSFIDAAWSSAAPH